MEAMGNALLTGVAALHLLPRTAGTQTFCVSPKWRYRAYEKQ